MTEYKIHLSAGGSTFEAASHDKDWVVEQEKKYESLIAKILSQDSPIVNDSQGQKELVRNSTGQISSKLSVNEFYRKNVMENKISSRPDIATFFIFYLSRTGQKTEFTANEVKEQFKAVGYPAWNSININDVLNKARQKALLNSVNNQWSLSITGEDFVLNALNQDGSKKK